MVFFALDFGKIIGHLRRFFFLAPACSLCLILHGKSESADVKTFFGLHLILCGKSDVCGRKDLFFWCSPDFAWKIECLWT